MKTSGKVGLPTFWTPCAGDDGLDEARVWALELAERTAEAMPKQATVDIRQVKMQASG